MMKSFFQRHFLRLLALGFFAISSVALAAEPTPGLMINASNVDQYKEYLPYAAVVNIKAGQVFKVIAPSSEEQLTEAKWIELTKANRGKAVMLDKAGTWGLADGSAWPGGYPFPGSTNPREIMANFQYHLSSDDFDTSPPGGQMGGFSLVDANGKEYKRFIINLTQRRMTSRTTVAPIGSQKGYENELYRTNTLFMSPYDANGVVSMNIIYRDQAKLPDAYIYVPALRRVKRLSANQRADAVLGTDLTNGDVDTFSDPLGMWDFKLLATKKLLSTQSNAVSAKGMLDKSLTLLAGYYPNPYSVAELRDTHIIEAIPRYNTIYSKKILYIDAVTYRPTTAEFYDRQGQLLKTYAIDWGVVEKGGSAMPIWIIIKNQQTKTASPFWVFDIKGNVGTPLSRVLEANMPSFGR